MPLEPGGMKAHDSTTPVVSGGSEDERKLQKDELLKRDEPKPNPEPAKNLSTVTNDEEEKLKFDKDRQAAELKGGKPLDEPAGKPFSLGKSDVSNTKTGNIKEETRIPGTEVYNTEDGLPPRYVAGQLEPVNMKKK